MKNRDEDNKIKNENYNIYIYILRWWSKEWWLKFERKNKNDLILNKYIFEKINEINRK